LISVFESNFIKSDQLNSWNVVVKESFSNCLDLPRGFRVICTRNDTDTDSVQLANDD